VINQNFLFGILFIIVVLSAGAAGFLTPVGASLLHVVGALVVVFNSARLVRQGEELSPTPVADGTVESSNENRPSGPKRGSSNLIPQTA
jgi:hypothetical protein